MNEIECFNILEISPPTSLEEIKRAYKKLALQHHPDICSDNGNRFKEIHEAYVYLMDNYHNIKKEYPKQNNSSFSEMFSEMFKSKNKQKHKHLIKLDISLKEAIYGFEKTLNIFLEIPCDCNIFIRKECKICKGLGFLKKLKKEHFYFEKDIYQNKIYIFKDFYENIDLHIKINILPEKNFKVRGKNIESDVDLSIFKSILGGSFLLETPVKNLIVDLPSDKIHNYNYVLAGEGLNGGDFIVRFNVFLPKNLTEKQRILIENICDET